MPARPDAIKARRSAARSGGAPAVLAASAVMPRFCLAKWKNCQAKNGSSSHVIAAGVRVAAAAAPAIISSTGNRMKRHGWLTA